MCVNAKQVFWHWQPAHWKPGLDEERVQCGKEYVLLSARILWEPGVFRKKKK